MIYEPSTDFFVKPDPRMAQFGDTAVVIRDYNEFIERFGIALFEKYEKVLALIDTVKLYGFNDTKQTNPIFSKGVDYAYQNELRMAFCELERDRFARGPEVTSVNCAVRDLSPVTLRIGDIRDIVIALPIDDFLNLRFPEGLSLKFPMSDVENDPTNYDNIVEWTREQMKDFKTFAGRPIVAIG